MNKLDDIDLINSLDKSQVAKSISLLGQQCRQVWQDAKSIIIPPPYKRVNNIVVNGMGGSALGSHIIRSLYSQSLKPPMRIIHSYSLPAFVNSKTLYLLSSYSGNTEEPLATVPAALRKKAKVMVITSGGKLKKIKDRYKLPGYVFNPKYNPCGQPRIGLGYSIFGQWALFKKAGLISLSDAEARDIFDFIEKYDKKFGLNVKTEKNSAKKIALSLRGKIPIIVAAEFLSGNAHAFSNQTNENAKNFSAYYLISELNHHLLEGLSMPVSNPRNLHFVFLESSMYNSQNQKRIAITKEILRKNNIKFSSCLCQGDTTAKQSFSALILGSYISFYLAILNGFNPSAIPWVDYFKKKLK